MTGEPASAPARVGAQVFGSGGRRIGRVDAVFVDYLLVRTVGAVPVDLYVPTEATHVESPQRIQIEVDAAQAYERWHRPLRAVAHD
jgi:hypothetical protein